MQCKCIGGISKNATRCRDIQGRHTMDAELKVRYKIERKKKHSEMSYVSGKIRCSRREKKKQLLFLHRFLLCAVAFLIICRLLGVTDNRTHVGNDTRARKL